jgi:hypothetical protein
MKAITTKYIPQTEHRPSRIQASDMDGNQITISYPYEDSDEANYRTAALALCKKMKWTGNLVGGGIKDGYVFCFVPRRISHPRHKGDASHPWHKWDGSLPKRCPACGMTESDALNSPCGGAR